MKRKFIWMAIVILALSCMMVGCEGTNTNTNPNATETPMGAAMNDLATGAAEMGEEVKDKANDVMNGGDIGVDKAKEMALKDAGKSEQDVTFEKTERTEKDGKTVYMIEFRDGKEKYSYEVNALDGSIRSNQAGQ